MDHRADFKLLVMEKLGIETANTIEWRYPRLICIAGDFTRYDEHAIQQIPRNIDLIRYRRYGDDLILLEQIATSSTAPSGFEARTETRKERSDETGVGDTDRLPKVIQRFNQSSPEVHDWYQRLRAFTLGLGEGVKERTLERYVAFRQVKKFAEYRFRPTKNRIVIDVRLDPQKASMEPGFTQSTEENWVRINVDSAEDVERAQPLIALSYQDS